MVKNVSLLHEAKAVASFGGRLAFAVSMGRDSAVMLALMSKLTDLRKHAFFFWSRFPELLPYQRRYFNAMEKRYGIHIDIRLWPESYKGKQGEFVREYMEQNGCSLCCFGYRMDESLQRRGMLKALEDGIDRVRNWAYPLRSFTKPKIRAYVKEHRVPLAPEYQFGLKRDLNDFRSMNAVYLRHVIGEEDYQAAIRMDPSIEVDYMRCTRHQEDTDAEEIVAEAIKET